MFALITFIIIFATLAYYTHVRNKIPKGLEGIPLISTWPILWAFIRQKYHDEIEDTIAKSSKGYDIYLSNIFGRTSVNINNPLYLKDFLIKLEDDDPPKLKLNFRGALIEFFGDGLIFANGDKWRTFRRLATPAFNNALSPDIVGETMFELFNFMQHNLSRPIDVFEIMQRTTIECLNSAETPHIINVYKYIISIVESSYQMIFPWLIKLPTAQNRKFYEANKEFNGFISDVIKARRDEVENQKGSNNGRIDLLSSMLELSNQKGIHTDSKQLRDEMVGFFVAGHDTTTMALSSSLYFLAKYPEMQERARGEVISVLGNEPIIPTTEQLKEMKNINAVIKESLRIHPPATKIIPRKLTKPMKIGPYLIPANIICTTNIWQINHDPKYWENPEQYNPERFLNNEKIHPFSWIPFSTGVRNCIGQNFSLMEQRVILSML
ncbi:6938_t:CDS:2, partial [Funneliformis mosseae]